MKARIAFETHVAMLEAAGYTVRRIPAFHNIAAINQQTYRLMAAEAADAHANLFAQFELLYRPRTSQLIRDGMALKLQERRDAAACQQQTYDDVLALMSVHEI